MSNVNNYTTDEAATRLRRQRRIAAVSSVLVSLLVVVLVGLALALILLPSLLVETPTIVAYSSAGTEEEQVEQRKIAPQIQRKPSPPSSSMAKVIASSLPSTMAIPVPEVSAPEPSMHFGSGDDFEAAWDSGDGGDGGGGGATFFGQKVSAKRIAYVIDFSNSMKGGGREQLMREELGASLDQVRNGTNYALIFFAGPAWVAGSTVKGKTVTGEDGKTYLWKNGWEHDGRKQPVDWLVATDRQLKASKEIVDETRLVGGTVWDNPLMMALEMSPPPQIIYFMTDGAARGSDIWAEEVGKEARKLGVVINCVAMMQPKAHDDMSHIAATTGGQFTVVKDGGEREKVR